MSFDKVWSKASPKVRKILGEGLPEAFKWYQANVRLRDRPCWNILLVLELMEFIRLPPLNPQSIRSKIVRIPFDLTAKADISLIEENLRDHLKKRKDSVGDSDS